MVETVYHLTETSTEERVQVRGEGRRGRHVLRDALSRVEQTKLPVQKVCHCDNSMLRCTLGSRGLRRDRLADHRLPTSFQVQKLPMPGRRSKRAAAAVEVTDAKEASTWEAGCRPEEGSGADFEAGKDAGAGGRGQRKKAKKVAVAIPDPAQLCFSKQEPLVRIATSGYSYKHWRKGAYYPQGLDTAREFEMYSKEFDALELNATFYGWFSEETFDSWRERAAAVRPSFEYIVKTSQFYTHKKRLNVDQAFIENWGRFWERCQRLRPHLGPVLFQFPANFKSTSKKGKESINNIDKLRRLGEVLPAGEKFVFEFRDISWYCQEVYDVLKQHDWCLAIVEVHDEEGEVEEEASSGDGGAAPAKTWAGTLRMGANPPPEEYPLDCCSWGVYVRYHGSKGQYCGTYGKTALRPWADLTAQWVKTGRRAYHAFNNDSIAHSGQAPSAILDCRTLAGVLREKGMRYDKSKVPTAALASSCQDGHGCASDVEDVPFCIPADGIKCKGCAWDVESKACYRNNCDALFTPKQLRERQREWEVPREPQLIVAAGPERSGSTWLYNAVRLLFEHAQQPLDAYYLSKITDGALDVRGVGQPGSHNILIKTHAWSDEWTLGRATHIFITHRDLREVVRSYRRLGWESNLPGGYVEDHMKWRGHAELDIAFEDIVGRPQALMEDLANRMGLLGKVQVEEVVRAINNLPLPTRWVDPVTQIWPSHISTPYIEERRRVSEGRPSGGAAGEEPTSPKPAGPVMPRPSSRPPGRDDNSLAKFNYLKQQHPEFFSLYGYA